jgi:hypothetical protein
MMWLDGGWYSLINRGFLPGDHIGIAIAQAALACCCKSILITSVCFSCDLQALIKSE